MSHAPTRGVAEMERGRVTGPGLSGDPLARAAVVWLSRILAAAAACLFVATVASKVLAEGVCCADDGAYALIAKNVATGIGYANTLTPYRSDYGEIVPYDPTLGSGPAVILPAAACVAVFGNKYWVPGFSVVMLWLIPLSATTVVLWPHFGKARASFVVMAFFVLVYALFPFHFEQWYALLGEVPASCLIVLGVAVWASSPQTKGWSFVAGLAFGLGVLSKTLTVLWFAGFAGVFLSCAALGGEAPRRGLTGRFLAALCGFAAPMTLFEVWKWVALGHDAYLGVSLGALSFIKAQGVAGTAPRGLWVRVTENSRLLQVRYGFSIWELLILGGLAAGVAWKRGSVPLRRTAMALYVGFVLHSLYWAALSRGWPRYMVIALVPFALIVCLPIATATTARQLGVSLAVLLVCLVPAARTLSVPLSGMDAGWFRPNERLRHAFVVSRYIDDNAHGKSVYTQWWAMVAAFEYQARERVRFHRIWAAANRDPREESFVVLDDRWLDRNDTELAVLLAACGDPVIDLSPYRVYRCGATAGAR